MILEKFLPFEAALTGRRIFITGHTGFTGAWATLWLDCIGAHIHGFSLQPETNPALHNEISAGSQIQCTNGNICNYELLFDAVNKFQPEIILHLAAQPLVRRSYREPLRTFAENVMGTAHVLEAARTIESVRAVLCITTDKVYKNNEWAWPYRENDPLGGKDPYSGSKAAAEMVIQSYSTSFPWEKSKGAAVATARGGNIIGGGDWSEDRLVPDFVRAVTQGKSLALRYPNATRPWQHVLALVHGYLLLLAGLISPKPEHFARAWNLGPQDAKQYSVRQVLDLMCKHWKSPKIEYESDLVPESTALALDSTLARSLLDWTSPWDTNRAVAETAAWYRDYYKEPRRAKELTLNQMLSWREGILI